MNIRVYYHPDFILADREIDKIIKSGWIPSKPTEKDAFISLFVFDK